MSFDRYIRFFHVNIKCLELVVRGMCIFKDFNAIERGTLLQGKGGVLGYNISDQDERLLSRVRTGMHSKTNPT